MRRGIALFLLLASAACAPPTTRVPLPVPFLPVHGAAPVPANGIGVGMEVGSALRGPELARAEARNSSIGVGTGDAVSVWYGSAQSTDHVEGTANFSGARQVRAKVVFARPLDGRAAIAVYGGHSWGDRFIENPDYAVFPATRTDTVQNDRVRSWELAVPAELRIGRRFADVRPSVFLGPRLTYLRYDDRVRPDGTFEATLPGAVAGLHVSAYRYEFFVEATLAYVPRHAYAGGVFGGTMAVMPAAGVLLRLGPPYRW